MKNWRTGHGTPVYVYSAETISSNFRRLRRALQTLDHMICYAVKACSSNLAILNLLARKGPPSTLFPVVSSSGS